jgi:ATP-binding cassette, subfamily B, bacterial
LAGHAMTRGMVRTFRLYRRAFIEARRHWPALVAILVVGLLWIPLSLLLPLPLKLVFDGVLADKPLDGLAGHLVPAALATNRPSLLATAIGLSILVGLLGIAHKFGDWLLRETVADRMVHRFRGELLLHGMKLPALHHAAHGTLDLGYRIIQDAPALQWTAIYGVIPVLVSVANVGCTLYVTAKLSPHLALIGLLTAVPAMLLVHLYQQRLKAKWHAAKEHDSAMQAQLNEVLGALRVVTVFRQERREAERFLARSWLSIAARLRAIRTEAILAAVLSLSTVLGTAGILFLGVGDVDAGRLSVGDLLLIFTYVGQLYAPLQAIGTHLSGQQHAIASMERVLAVLDQELAVGDRPNARTLSRARGDIAFRNVSFGYDSRSLVLRHLDFHIPAGSVVGITGRTGAGKSTLINLLLRLFDPSSGSILLDDVDLRDWRLDDLRRQFAVVPQDALLFSTTVAENISYGRPAARMDEIAAAAAAANAHDFIMRLPQGYETRVGERGVRLSGGERQRIALARALLADAPIIVLDEPTSAIDRNTEAMIVENLERLRPGRTIFIVAHRAATLRHADIRLHVEDGSVSFDGEEDPAHLRKVS